MKKQLILSIGREFGSGGHEVAELLASKLGIQLLDDNLLHNLASEKNVSCEELQKYDEKPKAIFFSRTVAGYTNAMEEHLAKMQFKYLKKLADEGQSFVIVGRCAEHVLKNYPCMISVFILGNSEAKCERLVKKYHVSREEALKLMKKNDLKRKTYHNYYCDGKWGDSRNYDLCVNSSDIGIQGTAGIILEYINRVR